ncbi:hypothetical protein BIV25_13225 [Streptomyces sp. MUSC 14]|uniref:LuxR C-terminal-related transcriptional regulator n=1 Tax=Streptomyces sp. MUSC 14 TaxID=1354889 RepID=UPI0008F5A50A|nr:LuxR C-terminal-related transcriptional regulator [Streptomyces sp. MUSC 14]OIJ97763.1 hypothetical protein BIV25_13225 [Streptomyces sp. MUSC 14]
MTTTVARVRLSPRERQVVEGLAKGLPLTEVAQALDIRDGTASAYLLNAKRRLHGVSENAAAVAVGYVTKAITLPTLLDPDTLTLPEEQRDLVPLIAMGMTVAQMAEELKRPQGLVSRDGRALTRGLGARNRAHIVTLAWQYRILTAGQVTSWLR